MQRLLSSRLSKIACRTLLGLLCLLLLVQFIQTLLPKHRRGDLGLVLDAAVRLRTAEPLYVPSEYLPHTKSPLATLAFVPLSFVPVAVMDKIWDLVVILSTAWLVFWCYRQVRGSVPLTKSAVLFPAFLCAFNPFVTELAFGQFNLLLMLCTVAAVYARSSTLGGALFCFSVLFKPTQIIFVPWVLAHCRSRLGVISGALLMVAGLAAVYVSWLGAPKLESDMLHWWQSTSNATPFHLGRPDNYGLPSLSVYLGMPPAYWVVFQVAGLVVAMWICFRVQGRFAALALCACTATVCSPMAWLHVYVLTFPLVILLWSEARRTAIRQHRALVFGAIAAYYWGTEVFNPTTEKSPGYVGCSLIVRLSWVYSWH